MDLVSKEEIREALRKLKVAGELVDVILHPNVQVQYMEETRDLRDIIN